MKVRVAEEASFLQLNQQNLLQSSYSRQVIKYVQQFQVCLTSIVPLSQRTATYELVKAFVYV